MPKPLSATAVAPLTNEAHGLSDGRTLIIRDADGGEEIELHSPDGEVELTISITAEGPVVKVTGARLELASTDTVSVRARVLDLVASEQARVHADGELTLTSGLDTRMVAEGEVHVLGKMIWLN